VLLTFACMAFKDSIPPDQWPHLEHGRWSCIRDSSGRFIKQPAG
jgi:hypothetical protein